MMKSYVSFLEGLYCSILRDCADTYPQSAEIEWTRDITRLRSCMKHRGLRFFTIDLPAFGKHFDKCLADGFLSRSGMPSQASFKNDSTIPKLFRVLLLRVFHVDGTIRPDVDTTAVKLLRVLYYAPKKLRMECPPEAVFATVKEFFDVELACRLPSFHWDSDDLDFSGAGTKVGFSDLEPPSEETEDQLQLFSQEQRRSPATPPLRLLQHVCDRVIGEGFGPLEYSGLRPKHGPGAVADARVGKDCKYSFPHWPAKLERIFPLQEFGYANLNAWEMDPLRSEVLDHERAHEPPSKLIAVPKTQKGPRLIASEPIAHQWLQQALKRELERMVSRSVLRHSICFADQEPSRRDALRSSLTGARATIDLSSASDRLSCYVVERAFRSRGDLLHAFHAVRTRWLVNSIDKKQPKYVVLRKFAPMGSALTFPVQSIVYALVAITAVLNRRGWSADRTALTTAAKQVRVYGDDIIVPVDCIGVLRELLTELGLKVNDTKTFSEGFFRESCGMDAYKGVDVTPSYVLEVARETRPESIVSVVASHNNFLKRGMLHVASYLQSTVPLKIRKRIPTVSIDSEAFGWYSYGGADYSGFKLRTNPNLHRREVKAFRIRSRTERRTSEGWQSLLQYFTEDPPPVRHWMAGFDSDTKVSLSLGWAAA